jgi:ubiquinone/menaquinone biosynthesis C-methylase UbiE
MDAEHRLSERLRNEIGHGAFYGEHGSWQMWTTPVGRESWQRRLDFLLAAIRPGMRILELGCGTGLLTKDLARTNARIVAVDISPDLVARARKEVTAENVEFRVDNAYELTFEDGSFDAVVGSSVLHHLQIHSALREFLRVLKPGGRLCFSEPNMANPIIFLQKNVPFLKRLAGDTPDETAFVRWSFRDWLKSAGYEEIVVRPYNFLHPSIPSMLLPVLRPLCAWLEKVPVASEMAGSLMIQACTPRPGRHPAPRRR